MPLDNLRSLLFAPGSDERKLRRALESGADAVVADLEDAVAPGEKDAARRLVVSVLAKADRSCALAVRINGAGSPYFAEDLAAVRELPLDGLVLPKATPETVDALGPDGPPVIAIVESAQGLRLSYETAAKPRVAVLMLGSADLGAELRLEPREDGLEILFARSKVVTDSAAAGVRSPIDVVRVDFRDDEGLKREALFARSLGFGAKACIHPAQVEIVNRVFAPTAEQIEWATRVIAAYEDGLRKGKGAVALDSEMVDLPVVERARTVLAMAGKL